MQQAMAIVKIFLPKVDKLTVDFLMRLFHTLNTYKK